MHACTAVAANFIPHARVLAESFREHHPGGRLTVLLLDDGADVLGPDEPFEVVTPVDVGVGAAAFERTAFLHDARGVADFVLPFLAAHGLEHGDAVLLLDADSVVLGPLDGVVALAREHGAVVTLHSLDPLEGEAGHHDEVAFIDSGVFNTGCTAFGPGGAPFAAWWRERAERDWTCAPAGGGNFAQPYLALGAPLFGAHVLRDRGVNVTGWALRDRDVGRDVGRWTLDGVPLRHFHFAGSFDPLRPDRLATAPGLEHWPGIAGRPGLAALCRDYADRLLAAGHAETSRLPWPYAHLRDGTPVDARMRRLYRAALLGHGTSPPGPWSSAEPEAFVDWLNAAPPGGPDGYPPVSRYLLEARSERPEVALRFAEIPGPGNTAYLEWVRDVGAAVLDVPAALMRPALEPAPPRPRR